MKPGERGQVTIPKELRERFAITSDSEVEFRVEGGEIVLRKLTAPYSSGEMVALEKWKGYCAGSLADLGMTSVDEYVDEVRGH